MSSRKKHLAPKPRGNWQYVYDGRCLLGMIEQQPDGTWAVIKHNAIVNIYPTRQSAIAALDAITEVNGEER